MERGEKRKDSKEMLEKDIGNKLIFFYLFHEYPGHIVRSILDQDFWGNGVDSPQKKRC